MSTKHTPGPWVLWMEFGSEHEIVSVAAGERSYVGRAMDREDARRIVDCVNAMEGIDDPAAARVILDDPKTEATTDMLAALKQLRALMSESEGVAGFHRNGDVMEWDSLEDLNPEVLDALIAKAEGRG